MNMPLKHRSLENEFSVVCLNRNDIFALGDGWANLVENAVEDNPYYSPAFMKPLLEHIDWNCDIQALAVYKRDVLVGFLPFVIDKWRWLKALAVNRAWIHPNFSLTVPLIDEGCAGNVVEALVEAMNGQGAAGSFWLFENFSLEGPVGALFAEALAARNLSSQTFGEFARPILEQECSFDEYMSSRVSKSRRRALMRNRKRLSAMGKVEMQSFASGPGLTAAVEDFLTIEAAGWKGAKGTALACNESMAAFARRAFGDNDGRPIARADLLYLNDRPIAASLSVYAGKTAFLLKSAYDETYRTYSPGLLLEQNIMEYFFDTRWVERLDSAVTVSAHVLQNLWNKTIPIGDFFLCANGAMSPGRFRNYMQIEELRRLFRRNLKYIVAKSRAE